MNCDEVFLQAIIDDPDDDSLRLVYADSLEERGDPDRAELIRVQCALAKAGEADPLRRELETRERELLDAHQDRWLAPLRGRINDWVFHRGMLGVAVDVPQFLAHAEDLARCPLIHYLDIVDHAVGRENIEALVGTPQLARVTILNLAGWYCYDEANLLVNDEQAVWLAASPFVIGLECLNLRCNAIGDVGTQALAASPHLGKLKELDLRVNRLGDAGVLALASSSTLRELTFLDLCYNDGRITDTGWMGLARAAGLPRLESLGLIGNTISEENRLALRARFGDRVHF